VDQKAAVALVLIVSAESASELDDLITNGGTMDPQAVFGISILISSLSSILIGILFVWPWLRNMKATDAPG